MALCKSCGASIRWVKTVAGKSMPIDAKPDPKGNIAMVDGVAHVVTDPKVITDPRYISHFATCPNSKAHRKD